MDHKEGEFEEGLTIVVNILPKEVFDIVKENYTEEKGLTNIHEFIYNNPEYALSIIGQLCLWQEESKAYELSRMLSNDGGESLYLDIHGVRIIADRVRLRYRADDLKLDHIKYGFIASTKAVEMYIKGAYGYKPGVELPDDGKYRLAMLMNSYEYVFIDQLFKPVDKFRI